MTLPTGPAAFVRPIYVPASGVDLAKLAPGRSILGVIGFEAARPAGLDPSCPFVNVALPVLGAGPHYEVWIGSEPVARFQAGEVAVSIAGDTMFGLLEAGPEEADLERLARAAYGAMFAAADIAGCPHLLRVFNYLPRILRTDRGSERYRLFNAGRHEAFSARGQSLRAVPAACALGTQRGAAAIYFLASSEPGRAVENPRQTSAYDYPPRYGRRSPSFSRAMVVERARGRAVFISGTSSIVGHETVHAGDASAQTDETLRNLDVVVEQCIGLRLADVADRLSMKVYVRRPHDLAAVQSRLAALPPPAGVVFLQADICRADLAVEIEAFVSA